MCLLDNIPIMTALANDCSYANIIEAVKTGKKLKMQTLAFLGSDGGRVKGMVDAYVLVPSSEYGPVEDYHLILNHLITAYFLTCVKQKSKGR